MRASVDSTVRPILFRNAKKKKAATQCESGLSSIIWFFFFILFIYIFLDRGKSDLDGTEFKFYLLEDLNPTVRPDDQGMVDLIKIGLGLKVIHISPNDGSAHVLDKIHMYEYYHFK